MRIVFAAAAGMLAYAGYYAWQQNNAPADTGAGAIDLTGTVQTVASAIDYATGGILKLSNMRKVTAAQVSNKNMQAMLHVIRTGEGTNDANGYRRIFGGQLFTSFADHPRITVTTTTKDGKVYKSSAAGAYQAIIKTWNETAAIMGLGNFSPANQDLFAVGRIAARGALDDVMAGRFDIAIAKLNQEWASLPGSPWGQPVISLDKARQVFASNGGTIYA